MMTSPLMIQPDLGDNTGRGAMICALIHEASQHAPHQPPTPWAADAVHPDPTVVHSAVGNAWKLHNDMCVLSQYGRVLRDACKENFFLTGAPATCVQGLEWFHSFAQPATAMTKSQSEDLDGFLTLCMKQSGVKTVGEAAFNAHRSIARPSRQLSQFLVEHHFPGPHKEYEFDVCAYILAKPELTYNTWQATYPLWRMQGLYYPLGLASLYMPSLHSWLPAEVHDTSVAMAFHDCLESMRYPGQDHADALAALAKAWANDTTGAAEALSGKLDRLAILMGVKSNGKQYDLATALAKFIKGYPACPADAEPADMHRKNYEAWHCARQFVEATFPPSLLSGPLVIPKRDTWGYNKLTLAIDDEVQPGVPGPRVRFAQRALEHVKSAAVRNSVAYTYQPAYVKECMLHQTSQRIQDVLWRLGEIATSPDMAICMLRPDLAIAALQEETSDSAKESLAPKLVVGEVLSMMGNKKRDATHAELYATYTEALEQSIPKPLTHYLPRTESVLFWRVDTPARALLYMGSGHDVDPHAHSTHHYDKLLMNSKVPGHHSGGIVRCTGQETEDALQDALCCYARDHLPTHPANTVLVSLSEPMSKTKKVIPVTHTTLAESIACFGLTRPAHVNKCRVGVSASWKDDSIDPRYAETQLADNGQRFRDWTAVHVHSQGTQQSRLASHTVHYDCIHTTVVPWFQDDKSIQWVQISSSLPCEPRTLHSSHSPSSLKQAVEGRFLHDLRLLPTVNGAKVVKSNCEIYADPSGTVGIVYCPDGSQRLEFMCFGSA